MFAKFFIDRPRFAMVISILMALAGVIAAFRPGETVFLRAFSRSTA